MGERDEEGGEWETERRGEGVRDAGGKNFSRFRAGLREEEGYREEKEDGIWMEKEEGR